jgi:hypothetical protein
VNVKISTLEELGHVIVGLRVDHDGPQDGLFGIPALGYHLSTRCWCFFEFKEIVHKINLTTESPGCAAGKEK